MITKNACKAMYKIAEELQQSAKIGAPYIQAGNPSSYFSQLDKRHVRVVPEDINGVYIDPSNDVRPGYSVEHWLDWFGVPNIEPVTIGDLLKYRQKQANVKASKYFPKDTAQYDSAVQYFKDNGAYHHQSYVNTGTVVDADIDIPSNIPKKYHKQLKLDARDVANNIQHSTDTAIA